MSYLISWSHIYLVHFGFWMSLLFGMTFYKEGLKDIDMSDFPRMFRTGFVLSAIMSIFSSHSHHLMEFMK
jgi:hypothetical protein